MADPTQPKPEEAGWRSTAAFVLVLGSLFLLTWEVQWWEPLGYGLAGLSLLGAAPLGLLLQPLVARLAPESYEQMGRRFWLMMLGLGGLGWAFALLLALNAYRAPGEPSVHLARVAESYYSNGFYWVRLESWLQPGDSVYVSPRPEVRRQLSKGAVLEVTTRPGRLGFEWVSQVELPPKD